MQTVEVCSLIFNDSADQHLYTLVHFGTGDSVIPTAQTGFRVNPNVSTHSIPMGFHAKNTEAAWNFDRF